MTALLESNKETSKNAALNDGDGFPGLLSLRTSASPLTPGVRDKGLAGFYTFEETPSTSTTAYNRNYRKDWGNLSILWQSSVNPNGPRTNGKRGKGFLDAGYEWPQQESAGMITRYYEPQNPPQQKSFSLLFGVNIFSSQATATSSGYLAARCWGNSDPWWCGYYVMYEHSSKKLTFFVSKNGNDYAHPAHGGAISLNNAILNDQWTHIAAVYDAENSFMKLYLDGALASSTPYTGGLFQKQPGFSIGCNTGNNHCGVAGIFDEVRVYDRALSEAEIKAIYDYEK